jgi:hypothetical protein
VATHRTSLSRASNKGPQGLLVGRLRNIAIAPQAFNESAAIDHMMAIMVWQSDGFSL